MRREGSRSRERGGRTAEEASMGSSREVRRRPQRGREEGRGGPIQKQRHRPAAGARGSFPGPTSTPAPPPPESQLFLQHLACSGLFSGRHDPGTGNPGGCVPRSRVSAELPSRKKGESFFLQNWSSRKGDASTSNKL